MKFSKWVENREFGLDSTRLYKNARQMLGMKWGGPMSPDTILTSTFIASAGLNVSDLLRAKVIVPAEGGNYMFNPTLDRGMRQALPALDSKPQQAPQMPAAPPPPPFLRKP